MTEALKCPECSAPLQYPAGGGASMRCPYCNTTVLLSGAAGPGAQRMNPNVDLASILGQGSEMAEVISQLRAGNKIAAIRVYRQFSAADLSTAKRVVEKIAEHHQLGAAISPALVPNYKAPAQVARSQAMSVGCTVFAVVIVIIAIGMAVLLPLVFAVRHTATLRAMPAMVVPLPMQVNATPAPPSFAHMTLEFGSEGIGAGAFTDARTIAADGQGHFYVGEYSDGRVQIFDADGKFISAWSIGQNKYLVGLAADRKGNVYVAVYPDIFIYEGATGKPLGEVARGQGDEAQMYQNLCVALDGDIYAIGNDSSIVNLGPDGAIKRIINVRDKVGEEVSFEHLTVNGAGEIYALEPSKGVFKFASDGHYINRFGGDPKGRGGPGRLSYPRDLAADGKGRIYVSENDVAFQVFDEDGNYLDSFGGRDVVFGFAITDQNEIYGCFRNKHVVRKFALDKKES